MLSRFTWLLFGLGLLLLAGCATPFDQAQQSANDAIALSAASESDEALLSFSSALQAVEEMEQNDPNTSSAQLMRAAILYRLCATEAFTQFAELDEQQKEQATHLQEVLSAAGAPQNLVIAAACIARKLGSDLFFFHPQPPLWVEGGCLLAMAEYARLEAARPDADFESFNSPHLPAGMATRRIRGILLSAAANFALAASDRARACAASHTPPPECGEIENAATKLVVALAGRPDFPAASNDGRSSTGADNRDQPLRPGSLSEIPQLARLVASSLAPDSSEPKVEFLPCPDFLRLDCELHQARGRASLDTAISEMLSEHDDKVIENLNTSLEHFVFARFLSREVSPLESRTIDDFIRTVLANLHSLRGEAK